MCTCRRALVGLFVLLFFGLTGSSAQEQLPTPTVYEFVGRDGTITLRMSHEIYVTPEQSPLFNYPSKVYVDNAGSSYWVDVNDRDVKVFNQRMEYVRTIGRKGQGPGEFAFPWVADFGADGTAYIYDNEVNRLSVFSSGGEFVESATLPVPGSTFGQACGVRLLPDGSFLLAAPALLGNGAGLTVHRFSMGRDDGVLEMKYTGSSYQAPVFEPAIAPAVLGCSMSATPDGGFMLSFWTPYRVSKWGPAGFMEWEHESDLLPDATDFFGLTPEGRIEIRDFPQSALIVQLADDVYLHLMIWPIEESARTLEDTGRYAFSRRLELVVVRGNQVESWCCVEQDEQFQFHTVDRQGRIYGFWNDAEMIPVRSTVHLERADR